MSSEHASVAAPAPADGAATAAPSEASSVPPPAYLPFFPHDFSLDTLSGRDLPEAHNMPDQIAAHLKATGGIPITRFPPEPNGYLHIGHAKSMNFNFGIAKRFGGQCIMRFDDTNPEAEKKEYIDAIYENLKWLGHEPSRVTYTSDYFQELYDLAVILIKKGHAYADHQTPEEIAASRDPKTKKPSPWRERPIEESLRIFDGMRKGKYAEGSVTIRMKGDMNHPNPQMWDMVAYRIKYAEHAHVGKKWCVYPTYDYSHCIIDSLENITHSLCTLEFEVRRETYFLLLHQLDLYKPKVWEFSRLQMEYTVMSKRFLARMVADGLVRGWDDPRLSTLNGIRRRGVPAEGIKLFCDTIGVSRNENFISLDLFNWACRTALEPLATRAMVVRAPIKVIITNYPEDKIEELPAPNFPKDPTKGTHNVILTRVVYIDADDFSVEDKGSKYFGLSVGKEVHLKYAYNIKAEKIVFEADGTTVKHVEATVDFENKTKCKGKITWAAEPKKNVAPLKVELRLYDKLFLSPDPMQFKKNDEWLKDINPHSLEIVEAFADPSLTNAKPGDYFQFERLAFFVCDKDSTPERLVFNRTVTLTDSKKPTVAAAAPTPATKAVKEPKAEKKKKEATNRGQKMT